MKLLKHIITEAYLLLEYDRDKTWKQHGNKLRDKLEHEHMLGYPNNDLNKIWGRSPVGDTFELNKHHKSISDDTLKDKFMAHVETLDSSPQKKHVRNIARIFSKDEDMPFEDLGRLSDALNTHHELSKRKIIPTEHRDIGKFNSLRDVENLVATHKDKLSNKEEQKQLSEKMNSPEHADVTNHGSFKHIVPKTEEASKFHGRGTRWCTASNNGNMFDSYNDRARLHIYIPSNPKYDGEKYQAHFVEGDYDFQNEQHVDKIPSSVDDAQVMRESDTHVNSNDLMKDHPDIFNHMHSTLNEMKSIASRGPNGLDHAKDAIVKQHIVKNADSLTDEQINKAHTPGNISTNIDLYKHMKSDDKRPYNDAMTLLNKFDPKEGGDLGEHLEYNGGMHMFSLKKHKGLHDAIHDYLKPELDKKPSFRDPYSGTLIANTATSKHITDEHVKNILATGIERAGYGMKVHHALVTNPKVGEHMHKPILDALKQTNASQESVDEVKNAIKDRQNKSNKSIRKGIEFH